MEVRVNVRVVGVMFSVTAASLSGGCEPAAPPPVAAAPSAAQQTPRPAPSPTAPSVASEPSLVGAEPGPALEGGGPEPGAGPAVELPLEAWAHESAAVQLQLSEGSSAPKLPTEWVERWRDVARSSIGTIARGGQLGQRVRVEGYLAHHGSGPQWGLLFVDFDDYLIDEGTQRGGLVALKFASEQDLPGDGPWASFVGRVVADPQADPQSPYSALAYLQVEDYLVLEGDD